MKNVSLLMCRERLIGFFFCIWLCSSSTYSRFYPVFRVLQVWQLTLHQGILCLASWLLKIAPQPLLVTAANSTAVCHGILPSLANSIDTRTIEAYHELLSKTCNITDPLIRFNFPSMWPPPIRRHRVCALPMPKLLPR
jgi:hypothetical protein